MAFKDTLKEFRDFAVKGNVVDLAVGIIIGAAFTTIVSSLVNDILMPPLGWVMGGVDFSNYFFILPAKEALLSLTNGAAPVIPHYDTLEAAKKAGVTVIAYGVFINAVINFLIVAFAIFMLVKQVNKLKKKAEAAPAAPAAPPADVVLLTEIRDLLKNRT